MLDEYGSPMKFFLMIILFAIFGELASASDSTKTTANNHLWQLSLKFSVIDIYKKLDFIDDFNPNNNQLPAFGIGAGYFIRFFNGNIYAGPEFSYIFTSNGTEDYLKFISSFNTSLSVLYFFKLPGEGLYLKCGLGRCNNYRRDTEYYKNIKISEWGYSWSLSAGYTTKRHKWVFAEFNYSYNSGLNCFSLAAGLFL